MRRVRNQLYVRCQADKKLAGMLFAVRSDDYGNVLGFFKHAAVAPLLEGAALECGYGLWKMDAPAWAKKATLWLGDHAPVCSATISPAEPWSHLTFPWKKY